MLKLSSRPPKCMDEGTHIRGRHTVDERSHLSSRDILAAVSQAGGLGLLGCAYLSTERIEAVAAEVRGRTDRPFALNLFVRTDEPSDAAAAARVSSILDNFHGSGTLGPRIACQVTCSTIFPCV
jgi:NAD(P)H-dependent flavin oxidoreductase YrpB (nitropropane dioxygenase family)